jgi:hypothetical protein
MMRSDRSSSPGVPALPTRLAAACLPIGSLLLAGLLLAPAAAAQSHLREATTIAVSNQGLYVVPFTAAGMGNTDPERFRVATPADFGLDPLAGGLSGALTGARVEWLRGTDVVMVSTSSSPAGPGHLYRVTLAADGAGGTQVAALETLAEGNFVDLHYAAALDVLYLLDAPANHALALYAPAHADGAALSVANDTLPGGGVARSLAFLPAERPSRLLVLDDTTYWKVPLNGAPAQVLHGNSLFERVENHPWLSEWYTLNTGGKLFGLPVVNLVNNKVIGVLQANLSGPGSLCEPASAPLHFAADVRADGNLQGLVVLTDSVNPCVFGGAAQGKNHVLRFPIAFGVGTTGFPVLHTGVPVSGIGGTKADIAFVRLNVPEIASVGVAQPAPGSPYKPAAGFGVVGGLPRVTLTDGPSSSAVTLALQVLHAPGPVGPLPKVARVADAFLPAFTGPGGGAAVTLDVPDALLGGARRLALQWVLPDGSVSQKLLLVVGKP